MKTDDREGIVKKEKTSKLWKIPPYWGSETAKSEPASGESQDNGMPRQVCRPITTATASAPSVMLNPTNSNPLPARSPMNACPPRTPDQTTPQSQGHSQQTACGFTPTPMHGGWQACTKGVLTFDFAGRVACPSREAVKNRMESMYPLMKRRLNNPKHGSKNVKAAWTNHIGKVWSIVSSVLDELEAKKSVKPRLTLELDRDSAFGMRVNYQMRLLQSSRMFSGRRSASAASEPEQNQPESNPKGASLEAHDKPSHEDVLAYKVLSKHFCYEGWMAAALVDTEDEFMMYPMPPCRQIKSLPPIPPVPTLEPQLAADRNKMRAEMEAKMNARVDANVRIQLKAEMKRTEAEAIAKRDEILKDARKKLKAAEKKASLMEAMMQHFDEAIAETAENMENFRDQVSADSTSLASFREWQKNRREAAAAKLPESGDFDSDQPAAKKRRVIKE